MKQWFAPKTYGYGYVPISWEGWTATMILLMCIMLSAYSNNLFTVPDTKDTARFLLDSILLAAVFLILFKGRCSAPLRWRWG